MLQNNSTDLRKAYRLTAIIGAAIMASLIVYTILVEILRTQLGEATTGPEVVSQLRMAFIAVVIVEFFAIQILKKSMLRPDAPAMKPPVASPIAPEAQPLVTNAIITFALCESVAIFGLVLFLVGRSTADFYLFLVISFFYFAIFFPRYSSWEEWLKEKKQTQHR